MSRFDRYLLSQLLMLFGFFSLVLVAIYWINRAVRLFDQLIGDGQTTLVFLEFSILALPNVVRLVLPISAFIATVYTVSRMTQESELVVMQAAGLSAFRLARPVLIFGLIVTGMMLVLMHVLVPASRATLALRSAEMSQNMTTGFLNDGQFMHPAPDVTLYIREITPKGELHDVFLTDDRSTSTRVLYTARQALLVRDDNGSKLVMIDGMLQTLSRQTMRMVVTRFADVTFDISMMVARNTRKGPTLDELSTAQLLSPSPALIAETGKSRAAFLFEGHSRFSQPLLATAAAMIGFSTLFLGAFSRFGLWRQILFGVLLLILVQLINTSTTSIGLRDARAWPLAYGAPLAGLAASAVLLWLAQRPRRRGRSAEVSA